MSMLFLERTLKVLWTNSAQSSAVDTEESRHNHENEKTNRFRYTMFHNPIGRSLFMQTVITILICNLWTQG